MKFGPLSEYIFWGRPRRDSDSSSIFDNVRPCIIDSIKVKGTSWCESYRQQNFHNVFCAYWFDSKTLHVLSKYCLNHYYCSPLIINLIKWSKCNIMGCLWSKERNALLNLPSTLSEKSQSNYIITDSKSICENLTNFAIKEIRSKMVKSRFVRVAWFEQQLPFIPGVISRLMASKIDQLSEFCEKQIGPCYQISVVTSSVGPISLEIISAGLSEGFTFHPLSVLAFFLSCWLRKFSICKRVP